MTDLDPSSEEFQGPKINAKPTHAGKAELLLPTVLWHWLRIYD